MINKFLYGKAFLDIRNHYVFPLLSTSVGIEKAEYWIMKNVLDRQLGYPIELNEKSFKLSFQKEDFYKSLVAQINLFQSKTVAQFNNFSNKISPNWQFVTRYYYSYLSGLVFLLFHHQCFTFLSESILNNIISLFDCYGLNPNFITKLKPGDYLFTEEKLEDNKVVINFSLDDSNGGSHAHLWKRIDILISEIIKKADSNEKQIYDQLHLLCNQNRYFAPNFPSETRNYFNYTPESAINNFNNKINFIDNIDEKFIDRFIKIVPNKNDSFYEKARYSQYYGIIISSLKEKLYEEYITRGHEEDEFFQKNGKITKFVI